MAKRELGVVIARFQSYALTTAHQYLLEQVATRASRVLVLLGSAPVIGTKRNPLEVGIRMRMVSEWWNERYPSGTPELVVLPLLDCPTDKEWASRIDATISAINLNGHATIYCGPDGAGPAYGLAGGKWPVEMLDSMGGHASKLRENLTPRYTEDFRAGVVYAVERRFVNPLPVVDMIIHRGDDHILLGQKHTDDGLWRLIGGFVDAGETLETAAKREVLEETGCETEVIAYIGSHVVDDWRFRGGPEKIISSVFLMRYQFGNAVAADDIDQLQWVERTTVAGMLHPNHQPLWGLYEDWRYRAGRPE